AAHELATAVRKNECARSQVGKLKLDGDVLGNDELDGGRVDNRTRRDLFELGLGHVAQSKLRVHDPHEVSRSLRRTCYTVGGARGAIRPTTDPVVDWNGLIPRRRS